MKPIRFKVCCISSVEEARMAIDEGASALGLVGHMPSGPGVISDAEIFEIAQSIPTGIDSFLVTSETDTDAIIDHHRRTRTSVLQLVDKLKSGSYQQIRKALPGIRIVQAIHVQDSTATDQARAIAGQVDAILLDSGPPMRKSRFSVAPASSMTGA